MIAGLMALLVIGLQDPVARRRMLTIATGVVIAGAMVQVAVPSASVVRSFSFATSDVEGTSSGRTEMWGAVGARDPREPAAGHRHGRIRRHQPADDLPAQHLPRGVGRAGDRGPAAADGVPGPRRLADGRAYLRAGPDDRLTVAAVVALFGAALANALFSYALHSNWELWLWAGVGTALAARLLRDRGARA